MAQPNVSTAGRGMKVVLGLVGVLIVVAGAVLTLTSAGALSAKTQLAERRVETEEANPDDARALGTASAASLSDDDIVAVYDADSRLLVFMTYGTKRTSPTYGASTTFWDADPAERFSSSSLPGWTTYRARIGRVSFAEKIAPASTAYWFAYLHNLSSIDQMAANLDTSNTTSMEAMFLDCYSLTSASGLNLSQFQMGGVESVRAMFSGCSSLDTLDLSAWDSTTNNTGVVSDWGSMFAQCRDLSNVVGLEDLDTSSAANMSYMFADCARLSSLDLSEWDTNRVSNSLCMFYRCTSLASLRLGAESVNLDTGVGALAGTYIPSSTTVAVAV